MSYTCVIRLQLAMKLSVSSANSPIFTVNFYTSYKSKLHLKFYWQYLVLTVYNTIRNKNMYCGEQSQVREVSCKVITHKPQSGEGIRRQ